MPRPAIKVLTRQRVRDYLALAVMKTPDEFTITIKGIAKDLAVSRNTLYKYGLDTEIRDSLKTQRDNARKSGRLIEKQTYLDIIDDLKETLADEKAKVASLQLEIILIEANSVRLGFDPEELRKEIPKPDRSISRAGNVKTFKRR